MDDATLFDVERPPPVSLVDRFVVPPFSVLDRRAGYWMSRKRRWLSMGMQSELGRDGSLVIACESGFLAERFDAINGGTSVFDPVLCELVYRWFSRPGSAVLDPFAGGSVRGVVASALERQYTGIDVRQEQIDANVAQLNLCSGPAPQWVLGDATRLGVVLPPGVKYDLVFSCPPYSDLEVYSDHPRDISTWDYAQFLYGHAEAIAGACMRLKPNRYAAWVIGDIRDTKTGTYRGLHHEAVEAFKRAGMSMANECIIVDPVGTAAARSIRPFEANRKVTLTHQHLLVFVKGSLKEAAKWASNSAAEEE